MTSRNPKNRNDINPWLRKYFSLFMLLVVILVLIAGYFLILRPKYQATLKTINDNYAQQQQYYASQTEKLANLKALNEFYKKIGSTDLARFNSFLPDQYAKEKLFGELEEVIVRNGFVVKSITLVDAADRESGAEAAPAETNESVSPQLGEIEIQLSLSAVDYAGFKSLLRLLENNLRLFDVTKLSFSPESESTSLTLRTYYYKQQP